MINLMLGGINRKESGRYPSRLITPSAKISAFPWATHESATQDALAQTERYMRENGTIDKWIEK